MHLGKRFIDYKEIVNSLKDSVEQHFSKVINQIEAGLPEVADEESKEGDEDDVFVGATTWTCLTCTAIN